jgi:hypothetical protein
MKIKSYVFKSIKTLCETNLVSLTYLLNVNYYAKIVKSEYSLL